MSEMFRKRSNVTWLIVLVAMAAGLINISHVLIGAFQTPPQSLYLWTGHYYADYFVYVQAMVQGARGSWLVENPYATDDPSRTLLAWGLDLLLGKIGGFLRISPFVLYWLVIAVFSFLLVVLIFFWLDKLLAKKPFYLRFSAFLMTLLAAPFFKIVKENGLKFIPYDFWYAPSKLFERLGRVPRHLLDQILGVTVILIISETFLKIDRLSLKMIIKRSLIAAFLIGIVLTFSYLAIILLVAIGLTGAYLLFRNYLARRRISYPILLVLIVIFLVDFPIGLAVKYFSQFSGVLVRCGLWDVGQQIHYPFYFVLLTIGPILVFVPFGLSKFFRQLTPLKLLTASVFLVSWSFYFLPMAVFFKASYVRFLTPLSYLFLGATSALGIETLAGLAARIKKWLFLGTATLLLLLFLPSNYFFWQRWLVFDPRFTYVSYPTHQALLFLDSLPENKAVLTAPTGFLGSYLPIFVDKKVYLGREFYTPNFEEKKALASLFYEGKMAPEEAEKLLSDNGIGYVFWQEAEGFSKNNFSAYLFLEPIFNQQGTIVFRVED